MTGLGEIREELRYRSVSCLGREVQTQAIMLLRSVVLDVIHGHRTWSAIRRFAGLAANRTGVHVIPSSV